MARRNFEFADLDEDDTTAQGGNDRDTDDQDGVEVDLSKAEKDDKDDDSPFDDLTPRKFLEKADERRAAREAEASDEDEEEDEEDDKDSDEDEPRSKGGHSNFRKRLLRFERSLEEVRDENKELVERNRALEGRIAKRETDEELTKKKSEAEDKLKRIRKELAEAKESGSTAREIELTEEMADVKADLKTAERRAEDAKEVDKQAAPVTRQPRLARAWMRKHGRFNSDPAFKAFVQATDKTIAAEGFDMEDESYYSELDKRVAKRFPEEFPNLKRKQEDGPRRRHPARGSDPDESQGGAPREQGGFRRTRKGFQMSESQLKNMRRFGMDPDNEADRKAYVLNNVSKK